MPTILCFGDSNTYGSPPMADLDGGPRLGPDVRWPGRLRRALSAEVAVIEEGLPGRTTVHDDPVEGAYRNGMRTLQAILESHRPLDLVILKLGTNDLKARFSVTAFDIALSVERLILAIESAEAGPDKGRPKILLIAPPPILETGCLAGMFEGGAEKSQALGELFAEVARRRGTAFLDAGRHIAVSALDGIHYDAAAHAVLAAAVAKSVSAIVG